MRVLHYSAQTAIGHLAHQMSIQYVPRDRLAAVLLNGHETDGHSTAEEHASLADQHELTDNGQSHSQPGVMPHDVLEEAARQTLSKGPEQPCAEIINYLMTYCIEQLTSSPLLSLTSQREVSAPLIPTS